MKNTQTRTRSMVLAAVLAAATAILAQIMLPIGPVPFNLALLGVFLAGCLLPVGWAVASIAVYVLLGVFGIPVFAGFSGGPAVLAGPTGGYIVGYLFVALLSALAVRSGKLAVSALGMIAGLIVCYALGTGWFMIATGRGLGESLMLCVVPFLLPDLAKGALALLVSRAVKARLGVSAG